MNEDVGHDGAREALVDMYPDELVMECGIHDEERLRNVKDEFLQMLRESDNEELESLLVSLDAAAEAAGERPKPWPRLLLDGVSLRIRHLQHLLDGIGDIENVFLQRRFDLDTIEVFTPTLAVFTSLTLVCKRDGMSSAAETDNNLRGRHFVRDGPGVDRPIETKLGHLPKEEKVANSGFSRKRLIGWYGDNSTASPLFMFQQHVSLENDRTRWTAWELCYEFVASLLQGSMALAPRSSSCHRGNTRDSKKYNKLGIAGTLASAATMSRTESASFMENLQSEEAQDEFFISDYDRVRQVVQDRYDEYDRRMNGGEGGEQDREEDPADQQRFNMRVLRWLHRMGNGGVDDDIAPPPGPGDPVQGECYALYKCMMRSLRFYCVIQRSRLGVGSILQNMQNLFAHGNQPADWEEARVVAQNVRREIDHVLDIPFGMQNRLVHPDVRGLETASIVIFPHIAMECSVVQRMENGQLGKFTCHSDASPTPQTVRLHLDKGLLRNHLNTWYEQLRVGRRNARGRAQSVYKGKMFSQWGNLAGYRGPCSFKGTIHENCRMDWVNEGNLDEISAFAKCMLPQTWILGRVMPMMSIYECTSRGLDKSRRFGEEDRKLTNFLDLVLFGSTRASRAKSLDSLVEDLVRLLFFVWFFRTNRVVLVVFSRSTWWIFVLILGSLFCCRKAPLML